MEIYNEAIRDLLDPRKDNLQVRESPSKGIFIDEVTEEVGAGSQWRCSFLLQFLTCPEDVWALLAVGDGNKAKASTAMNARSSRSHSVFIVTLIQKSADGGTKTGKLNLVDLAGSEKVGKTGASGSVLEEAKSINKSLSVTRDVQWTLLTVLQALGNCINALTSGKKGHIPFRDSKLTRILQVSPHVWAMLIGTRSHWGATQRRR